MKISADRSTLSHSLSVSRFTKRYGGLAAVDDVSFTIERGKFVTLLGPSGSGKTTLLMSIAGFVQPTAGDILLDDRVITNLPPEERNFGMVFQGYALFPHMTVADNVWFPLRARGIGRDAARDDVSEALDLVQMGHLSGRLPAELSGGQQQRAALARALVFRPHVLLLDEPLSALDKKLRTELQWELKELHLRLGTTFIYVTHDQEEALSMSDDIVVLRDGRVEQRGAPNELYERPATRFVADFLGKSNFISGKVGAVGSDSFRYSVENLELVQSGRPESAGTGDRVLVALRPEKIMVMSTRLDCDNALAGTIAALNYHGTNYQLQVETVAAGRLAVSVPAWNCPITPEIGAPVWLGWEANASVVVRET